MKTEHINELLKHPDHLSVEDLGDLQNLVRDYPWCQSFQLLYAKALKLNDDPGFNHQLKKTAIYASDRKILYRLIMQPGLQQSISDFETLTTAPVETHEMPTDHDDSGEEETLPDDIPTPVSEADAETAASEIAPDENDPIDSSNLEKELLKEVAARAYQIEFESSPPEKESHNPPSDHTAPEPVEPEPKKPMTFIDFISSGSNQPPSSPDKTDEAESEKAEDSLIARFIQNEPKIERKKSSFFSPANMGKMSLVDNDEMVTETLAGIYAKQGDTDKARRAYEQLALKYPEKSIYFAGLIKKLEESKPKK